MQDLVCRELPALVNSGYGLARLSASPHTVWLQVPVARSPLGTGQARSFLGNTEASRVCV